MYRTAFRLTVYAVVLVLAACTAQPPSTPTPAPLPATPTSLPPTAAEAQPARVEEIAFESGPFHIVGDLSLPGGKGPYPLVVFDHGDGPVDRTSFGLFPPIIERMLGAGYATFAWDKPGSGESTGEIDRSRLQVQRTQILLDAIEVMKRRPDIDPQQIGLWGVSQACYVMPRVLASGADIAFMIGVSCPAMGGNDQMAYLLASQATCAGVPAEKTAQLKSLRSELDKARTYETYDEYLRYREVLEALTALGSDPSNGYKPEVIAEDAWKTNDPGYENSWNPIEVIGQVDIPVLAFFGEKDTQADPIQGAHAYRAALERTGNPNSRVELLPGVNHILFPAETGCMDELGQMVQSGNVTFAPEYLDITEAWLRELRR